VWVQLAKKKWLPVSRKRHQIRRLDFRPPLLLTGGLHAVFRVAIGGCQSCDNETRHQFVTKTRSFKDIFAMVRTGKAKQAKRFSFLTTQLTRWRSAVRARTGLPYPLMAWLYILQSKSTDRFYVGTTNELARLFLNTIAAGSADHSFKKDVHGVKD
jgi:hypothetical protein